MRIAILGTRGIPARYGGFETFAEELATRLAERGHHVSVYCRTKSPSPYRGVELRYLPSIRHKYFDTLAHTALSTAHLLCRRVDVALYCNGANAIFTAAPRLFGIPVALNVDGLERNRKKWNALAKAWYHLSEWLATFCPTAVITDAQSIHDYYRERYHADSVFIPYGAEMGKVADDAVVRGLGLEPGRYFLYVSRMEPENNPLLVRQSFEQVRTDFRLALSATRPMRTTTSAKCATPPIRASSCPAQSTARATDELGSHCFAYIHATEVGGTHPALIEAMGRGALVLYLDTKENAEVAADTGVPFGSTDLAEKIEMVLAMSEEQRDEYRRKALQRVRERYSWNAVTDEYERLFQKRARAKP